MITANEIIFKDRKDAYIVGDKLIRAGYAIMVTYEKHQTIINYTEANHRNAVIFLSREDWDEFLLSKEGE